MAQQPNKADHRIDETGEESFPASDPPTFRPITGAGHRPEPDATQQHRRTIAAEAAERARDPHGIAPARVADEDEPMGWPTADRHRTETAIHRIGNPNDWPFPGRWRLSE
jgi:hypothetical protein